MGAFANETSAIAAFRIEFDNAGNVAVYPSKAFDQQGLYIDRYERLLEEALPLEGHDDSASKD